MRVRALVCNSTSCLCEHHPSTPTSTLCRALEGRTPSAGLLASERQEQDLNPKQYTTYQAIDPGAQTTPVLHLLSSPFPLQPPSPILAREAWPFLAMLKTASGLPAF